MNNNLIVNKIEFPKFKSIKCNMMPFIQGDPESLPEEYKSYAQIIKDNYLQKGKIGFLTIDESFVDKNKSQRGYNSANINRNVHIEVGIRSKIYCWGGNEWGSGYKTLLHSSTEVLISNSISDTCRVWDTKEYSYTFDGDLSAYIDKYPEYTGKLLKKGEVAKISIFTPHECVNQKKPGERQFFRIVGEGVSGREDYFTINPKLII